jgi:hypothetical protein
MFVFFCSDPDNLFARRYDTGSAYADHVVSGMWHLETAKPSVPAGVPTGAPKHGHAVPI